MFCLYLLVFRNRIGFCFIYMYNRYINIYFVAVTCRTQAVSSALLSFSGIHLSHPMPPHFLVLLFWLGPLYNVEILQVEFLSGTTPPTLFKKIFLKEMLLYLHYEIFTLRFLFVSFFYIDPRTHFSLSLFLGIMWVLFLKTQSPSLSLIMF